MHNQLSGITCLQYESYHNLLFIGNKSGTIVYYRLDNYNEKIIPQNEVMSNIKIKKYLEFNSDSKVRVISIKLTGKKEIIVGFSNGSVGIYSHERENPECKL